MDNIWDALGIQTQTAERSLFRTIMPITTKHLRDIGIVHGGATCGLIDRTMKGLIMQQDRPGSWRLTDSKVSFLHPGKGGYLTAEAVYLSASEHRKLIQCQVFDNENRCIASSIGVAVQDSEQASPIEAKLIQFTDEEQLAVMPEYVQDDDRAQPFREHLKIERTIWKPGICEMELKVAPCLLEPDGGLPHSMLTILTDMAAGQATKSVIRKNHIALTLELSAHFRAGFQPPKRLIVRGRTLTVGRIIQAATMIFNEKEEIVGIGSTTYYAKTTATGGETA